MAIKLSQIPMNHTIPEPESGLTPTQPIKLKPIIYKNVPSTNNEVELFLDANAPANKIQRSIIRPKEQTEQKRLEKQESRFEIDSDEELLGRKSETSIISSMDSEENLAHESFSLGHRETHKKIRVNVKLNFLDEVCLIKNIKTKLSKGQDKIYLMPIIEWIKIAGKPIEGMSINYFSIRDQMEVFVGNEPLR